MPRPHAFRTKLELPLARERVFPFFADAANLQRITPPELHFQIVTPLPIVMAEGTLIRYRLRLMGVPFDWLTRIGMGEEVYRFGLLGQVDPERHPDLAARLIEARIAFRERLAAEGHAHLVEPFDPARYNR